MNYLASNTGGGILVSLKETINSFINEQLDLVFEYSDMVSESFKYIALIGVLIKIFVNFRNDPMNWWGYLSYLPLTFLLFNYNVVVEGVFDLTSKADSYSSTESILEISSSFFQEAETSEEIADVSFWDMTVSYVLHEFKMMLVESFVYLLLLIGLVVSTLIYVYLKLKILLKLMVLSFFGPLNISLSFVPSFEGSWRGWLMKIIEVCLYIPVLYLIDYLGVQLLTKVFKPYIVTDISSAVESLINSVLGVIFYVILIFTYLSVDKIVAFGMTNGAGAIGTGRKLSTMAMMAARKAILKI